MNPSSLTETRCDAVRARNGATLLVEQDVTLSEVAVSVHVETGYRTDPDGLSGLSHLVEHLLFDVDPYAPFSYGRFVAGRGGRLNAQTFEGHTAFWTVAPPNALTQILDYERTRWASFDIRKQTFGQHVDHISTEVRNRREAPFGGFPWPDTAFLAFGDSPYGRDGLGSPEVFETMTPEQVRGHHRTWYTHPEDMVVAVCGPRAPEEVLPDLLAAFEALPSNPEPSALLPTKTFRGGTAHLTAAPSRVPRPAALVFLPIPTVDEDVDAGMAAVVFGEALLILLRSEFPHVRFSASAGLLGMFTAKGGDVLVVTALGWEDTVESLHAAVVRLAGSPAVKAVTPDARVRAYERFAASTTTIEARATTRARLCAFIGEPGTISSLAEHLTQIPQDHVPIVAERATRTAVGLASLAAESVR